MSATASHLMGNVLDALQIAETAKDFQDIASEGARIAGFNGFFYIYGPPGAHEMFSSYSASWERNYLELSHSDQDPILRRARRETRPFKWDFRPPSGGRVSAVRLAREAARHGIQRGITVPIYAGFGRFAALTFAGSFDAGPAESQKPEILDGLALLSVYFHVYYTSSQISEERHVASVLTWRQRQCLTWSAKGKTMSETGGILGISQRTVLFHLQDARLRLNAQTLPHAVAEAIGRAEIPRP